LLKLKMKMKLKFVLSLCLLVGLSHAQTVQLNESFNNGIPGNWTLIDGDMATANSDVTVSHLSGSFHLLEDLDSTGTGDSALLATSWFDNDTTPASNYLITPAITFPTDGNYLHFQAKSYDGSYPDGLEIFYTTDVNLLDSVNASNNLFDTIAAPPHWTNFSVKMDSLPLNSPIYLVFRHYADDQFILGIDNISVITGDLTTIESSNISKPIIYPNPSNGQIQVSEIEMDEKIQITSLSGQVVWKGVASSLDEIKFDKGVYMLNSANYSTYFLVK